MTTIQMGENNTILGVLKGADFNSTADQAILIGVSKFIPRRIVVTNATANLTLAAGGIYTATSKGGTPVVANTQIYTALTGATKFLDLTLAAGVLGDIVSVTTLYLSLTVAQGGAALGDLYIFGDPLP